MNLLRNATLLVLPLALSACMIPTGPVEVTRFNRVAEGVVYGKGGFSVTPGDAAAGDTLKLSPYLAAVQREMLRVGYTQALDQGDVIAEVSINRVEFHGNNRGPVSVGVGGSTGSYGSGVGVGVGVNLNALGDQRGVETTLNVRILRTGDRLVIWEGRAVQRGALNSPAAQPGIASSKLAAALFKDFPGTNGETVTVP
ncbi:DUF4136 domain-containing protein [Sphingorhabdus sp.]|jgi:hypothetical protein|uniref:DUF4136 domain-containing protein n=1 Tax=Sphingorhabdus sp. TaxID=1902408 RepID=UPI0035B0CA0B|nr:hypothetical protein [Sphingomonadaceae bacterium]